MVTIESMTSMHIALTVLALLAPLDAGADAKAGEKKAQLCLTCHKPRSPMAMAPLLEAQPARYLVKAMDDYKTGKRSDPGLVMKTNVGSLSTRDIKDVADYFASQPGPRGAYATDPDKAATGKARIADSKCGSCHGASFTGSESVPRLAGQTPGYIARQLEAFAEGRRSHPPTETPFDRIGDFQAVAHYFAATR
jgi:cytochrome c553